MILHENATFQAILQSGNLVVTDRSPDLPPPPEVGGLIAYLNQLAVLAQEQWRVDRMHFDGFTLTIHMRRGDPDRKTVPHYLINTLAETPALASGGHPFQVKNQKSMIEKLKAMMVDEGWHELATSRPLADLRGAVYIISIWVKE